MATIRAFWRRAAFTVACVPVLSATTPADALRNLTIVGTDYAFVVKAPVRAGLTAVAFENRGAQRHEMNLVRLRRGVTPDSVLKVPRGAERRALFDVNSGGIMFAEPGQRTDDRLLIKLEQGRSYFLICNFRDAPDKPEHVTLGMFNGFIVQ